MAVVHTLLLFMRPEVLYEDLTRVESCLNSLQTSQYKEVVIYNQGPLSNHQLGSYLQKYSGLKIQIIGDGTNVGIVRGRQACFENVWAHYPHATYISEIHVDMVFTYDWEAPLVEFLEHNEQEPMVCCGIVDRKGHLYYLYEHVEAPNKRIKDIHVYLEELKRDQIVFGVTHPCIHRTAVLKEIGGIDLKILKGKQSYEDTSLLIGYYYYMGTKINWRPKVNFNSVVYHEVEGQRMSVDDDKNQNLHCIIKQYGAMGMKALTHIYPNPSVRDFFENQYEAMLDKEAEGQ